MDDQRNPERRQPGDRLIELGRDDEAATRSEDHRARAGGWHGCRRSPGTPVWTDDFSKLLGVVDLDG